MAQRVAVLGLGTMGGGMADNLLKAGYKVTVYNRSPEKAEPLRRAGAEVGSTPGQAVNEAEFVISMLADDAACRSVWMGEQGALNAMNRGTVLIESSTVTPAWVGELAAAAEKQSLELLDAPVTGSRAQAAAGQLTFLVGGSAETLAKATPVLKAIGKEIVHLGPTGSGAKMKLINNFLCGVQIASLAEGLTWIERSGLDRSTALGVLKSGAPGSPLLKAISARMEAKNYEVNFLLRLLEKDLTYAEQEAALADVELSTCHAARERFQQAIAHGYGDADMSSVIETVREDKRRR